MNHFEIEIIGVMWFLALVPFFAFVARTFHKRKADPAPWENGLWFILAFLFWPVTFLYTLIVTPIMLIIAVVAGFSRSPSSDKVRYFSLGSIVGTVFNITLLGLLNTFAVPR